MNMNSWLNGSFKKKKPARDQHDVAVHTNPLGSCQLIQQESSACLPSLALRPIFFSLTKTSTKFPASLSFTLALQIVGISIKILSWCVFEALPIVLCIYVCLACLVEKDIYRNLCRVSWIMSRSVESHQRNQWTLIKFHRDLSCLSSSAQYHVRCVLFFRGLSRHKWPGIFLVIVPDFMTLHVRSQWAPYK